MSISLRGVLSRLTAIALAAAPAGAGCAAEPAESTCRELDRELESLGSDEPIDREHLDPSDAATTLGRTLALALSRARPLTATQLATTWALSDDPVRRLAIGRALEWPFALVGDAVVIDHLANDPAREIRIAAARAAWARRTTGGDSGVLDRLRSDPDPGVRDVASRALADV